MSNIYDGKQEEIDITEISNKLNSNIDAQNVRTTKNSEAIDEFVKHICQAYKDTIISTKYDKTINNKYEQIVKIMGQVEKIVITVLIINAILLILLNIKNIIQILLNIQTIALATTVIQFIIPGIIKSNVNISGIKVFNEAFSNSVVVIIKDILTQINKVGITFLIIYIISVIIYSIIIFCKKTCVKEI